VGDERPRSGSHLQSSRKPSPEAPGTHDEEQPTTTREPPAHVAFDVADWRPVKPGQGGRPIRQKLIGRRRKVEVLLPAGRSESPLIKNTLAKDPTHSEAEALEQIYALLRPGDAPNLETARQQLQKLFFNPKRYDLGRVGRYKINQRLKLKTDPNHTVLWHRHHPVLDRPERWSRLHRRHRPSRQPPDPVGG
jgi:hypothetical protein